MDYPNVSTRLYTYKIRAFVYFKNKFVNLNICIRSTPQFPTSLLILLIYLHYFKSAQYFLRPLNSWPIPYSGYAPRTIDEQDKK